MACRYVGWLGLGSNSDIGRTFSLTNFRTQRSLVIKHASRTNSEDIKKIFVYRVVDRG